MQVAIKKNLGRQVGAKPGGRGDNSNSILNCLLNYIWWEWAVADKKLFIYIYMQKKNFINKRVCGLIVNRRYIDLPAAE